MAWKPEYEENRKRREQENPELREKRLASSKASHQRNKEHRKKYMEEYRAANPEKWDMTEEKRARKNEARRKKYAENAAHREEMKRQTREWQAKNPEKRLHQRMKQFGITGEDYHRMLEAQGHSCAICGSKSSGDIRNNRFAVDHCHSTNKVRGLLCMNCNMGIGKFKDNTEFLKSAITYLQNGGSICQ